MSIDIDKAVDALLKSFPAITSLAGQRISADYAALRGLSPTIVFSLTDPEPVTSLGTDSGLEEISIQITVAAESRSVMVDTAQAIDDSIKRYTGTVGGVEFVHILREPGGGDLGFDTEIQRHGRELQYTIAYKGVA